MDFKQLLKDDDAVSPVIGVILMVAITVILAAVIATFVLGLGDSLSNTAPQASFDFNPNDNSIIMTGGDSFDGDNVAITGDISVDPVNGGSTVTAGTDINDGTSFSSTTEIRIVWTSPEGGDSAVIGSFNA